MKRPPRGFTVIEVLVVVFVTVILALILIMALRSGREVKQRVSCVDNLKRIGLALHSYHGTHNCYPLGVTASLNPMSQSAGKPPGIPVDWSGWSPQAQLLPYLEQTPIYNAINFDFDPFVNLQEPFNTTAHHWKISGFLCPDDREAGKQSLNSYYGSLGTNIQGESHQTTGIFAYQKLCRVHEVTDGLANTLAFAEGLAGNWRPERYRGNGVINVGTRITDPTERDRLTATNHTELLMKNLQTCDDAFTAETGATSFSGNRGCYWTWGSEGMTLFNTLVPPNSADYHFNQCRFDCQGCVLQAADHSDITNASSSHPGGANALFCDGGVRFLKGSMAMPAWWALGTKSGGESVADSY